MSKIEGGGVRLTIFSSRLLGLKMHCVCVCGGGGGGYGRQIVPEGLNQYSFIEN